MSVEGIGTVLMCLLVFVVLILPTGRGMHGGTDKRYSPPGSDDE